MGISRRHINSEEHQFKTLLNTYNTQLFSRIISKIKDRENAKDVLQEVLVHLWKYRSEMNSASWETIVFNTCNQKIADFFRKNRNVFHNDTSLEYLADHLPDDLNTAAHKEQLFTLLETSIASITPPIRQTIFRMNKLQGYSQQKIALRLSLTRRMVQNHLDRAMQFLKDFHN